MTRACHVGPCVRRGAEVTGRQTPVLVLPGRGNTGAFVVSG